MKTLEQRYVEVVKQIGTARFLNLPEPIKDILMRTFDLETKVKMLELIAKTLNPSDDGSKAGAETGRS